jgi:hypothetical protein
MAKKEFLMSTMALFKRLAVLLLLVSLAAVPSLHAQEVNVSFGMGTATDSATPIPLSPDGINFFPRSHMGGLFGQFGGDVLLTPHMGVGFEYAFRFAQADYVPDLGLTVRPGFYDFNFVYQPLKEDAKIAPVLRAGLGGARTSYYINQQSCSVLSGCSSVSTAVDQANHFQLHIGAGIRWHFAGAIFVQPQFDLHWVHGYNDPNTPVYGSNWVPQYTVSIGYTIGAH